MLPIAPLHQKLPKRLGEKSLKPRIQPLTLVLGQVCYGKKATNSYAKFSDITVIYFAEIQPYPSPYSAMFTFSGKETVNNNKRKLSTGNHS